MYVLIINYIFAKTILFTFLLLYLPEKRRMNMNRKVLVRTTGWQSAFIQLLTDYMAAYGYEVTADPEEEMNEVSPGFILYDETSKERGGEMGSAARLPKIPGILRRSLAEGASAPLDK